MVLCTYNAIHVSVTEGLKRCDSHSFKVSRDGNSYV